MHGPVLFFLTLEVILSVELQPKSSIEDQEHLPVTSK